MGDPRIPDRVKLIVGLLAVGDDLLQAAQRALADRFGAIDDTSEAQQWTISTYYSAEMGDEVRRRFLSFSELIAPDDIARLKLATNELENRWLGDTGRRVNVDPGYVATTKLVLATTKDAAHRIYLRDGIYAEATLGYESGSFRPYSYTYADYAAPAAIDFFNQARATYLAQLRETDTSARGHR